MNHPRIMLAGQSSGSGKTLVTCGILQALVNRGMDVTSFKCGPDYIDPMFHERVIGTKSRNLDTFFLDDDMLKYILSKNAGNSEISVIEGVMGFYDGKGIDSTDGSSHDVSRRLETPVVLVVNCKGASISCMPVIKGFLSFTENNIKGVILNNMSPHVYEKLGPKIESEFGVKVLGHVPKVTELVLESRHLGLVMPSEIDQLKEKLNALAEVLEQHIDIDELIKLANTAPELEVKTPEIPSMENKVKIAVARDDVFCFTYEDNLELLEEIGAEIVYFSPLEDEKLPDGISGIVLSGGYPELHAEKLSNNTSMLKDIRDKIAEGMPCIAECGGFMYLHSEMEDKEGKLWKMADVISGKVENKGKLMRFGYIELSSDNKDSMIFDSPIKGHEFHYWDSEDCGCSWEAVKTNGKKYNCVHETPDGLAAGFPHLYYYSNPEMPHRFLLRCLDYSKKFTS